MLDIFPPLPIVKVSILVLVGALVAQVVLEGAIEDVTVEEDKLALHLLVIVPSAGEDCALAEVVSPPPLLLPFMEVAHVLVLIHELESALAVGDVVNKLARIGAAVSIDHPSPAVLAVVLEAADVIVLREFIEVVSVALPSSVGPLAFVEFFLAVIDAVAVLEVVLPGAVVVGHAVVVEVDALAFHDAVVDESIVDLSVGEDVDALTVEDVALP